MKSILKIVFFIFFLTGSIAFAQDYPKYKTKKTEGTVVAEPKAETKKSAVEPANTTGGDFAALMEKAMGLSRDHKYTEAVEIYTQAIPLSKYRECLLALFSERAFLCNEPGT